MSTHKDCLIIFAKKPVLGKVKTRLARSIGEKNALELYVMLIEHVLDSVIHDAYDVFVYWDQSVGQDNKPYVCQFPERNQIGADLGERMSNAFADMVHRYDSVVIIGCDCPGVSNHVVLEAFEALRSCDVVIGPARDSGYYLIGAHALHADIFNDIEWGTSHVYAQTQTKMHAAGVRFVSLPYLSDIDVYDDLSHYADPHTQLGRVIARIMNKRD